MAKIPVSPWVILVEFVLQLLHMPTEASVPKNGYYTKFLGSAIFMSLSTGLNVLQMLILTLTSTSDEILCH